jgi:hypothetical protein
MRIRSFLAILAVLFIVALGPSIASANYVYVGSWQVDQGPWWTDQPLAYTGQQAAALLFGGNASDYSISTVGLDPLTVNHEAWYSVLGATGGYTFAENYVSTNSSQAPGYYYSGSPYSQGDSTEAASAYVSDNAQGSYYTNYAFTGSAVPLPPSVFLLGSGLLGLAGLGWRRKRG